MFSSEGLNSRTEYNLERYWQRRNTYHSFGLADCHQIGQKIFLAQLAKHMGIVSHHYGDLVHHFAVRLPLAAEQVHSPRLNLGSVPWQLLTPS